MPLAQDQLVAAREVVGTPFSARRPVQYDSGAGAAPPQLSAGPATLAAEASLKMEASDQPAPSARQEASAAGQLSAPCTR
jgi:hypothetical protein